MNMMKKKVVQLTGVLCGTLLMLGLSSTAFALSLGPGDADFTGDNQGNDIEALEGLPGMENMMFELAYKFGPEGEEGPFLNYDGFRTDNDADGWNDFLIGWEFGDIIDCSAENSCWLVVKDGDNEPGRYFYNLGAGDGTWNWDGTEQIVGTGFWQGISGDISHVAIYTKEGGGEDPPAGGEVPEPGTVLLFGTGLAGLGYWRLRSSKRKA